MTMRWGIRARITSAAAALFLVALVGASVVITMLAEREARAEAKQATIDALAERSELPGSASTREVVRVGDELGFGVFRRQGELAFGSVYVDGVEFAIVELNLTQRKVNELQDPVTFEQLSDPALRSELERLALVIRSLEGSDGELLLVGAPSPNAIDLTTDAAQRALWLTVPAVLVVAVILTWIFVDRAMGPVDAITDQVRTISIANLDERVPEPAGDDEIARLARTMNDMLGRLEDGDRRQRQFSADVSHELRSPLATVRVAAELIGRSPQTAPRHVAEIVAGADRMERIIDDLLTLAVEEGAAAPGTGEPVDLTALCEELAAGTPIEVDAVGAALVVGRPEPLRRVVANLTDNARRHATGQVRLTVLDDKAFVHLVVEDDGPGIPPSQRRTVFERFVRLDEARARDDGGAGLGLSVVATIVRAHHGTVTVDASPELGGARFVVTLPAESRADPGPQP